jgi:hypothetical protein
MFAFVKEGEVPVKLNTATVLREGNLYKKQTDLILSKFENLEKGTRDASTFFKWQGEMKQADNEKRLVEIEKRKIESKMVYEQAIMAKTRLTETNKQKAERIKKESRELSHKLMSKKQIEELEQQQMADKIRKTHENAKNEQKKLQMEKKKVVDELQKISRQYELEAVKQVRSF